MGLRDSLIKAPPSAVDDFTIAPLTDLETYPMANYAFQIKIDDVVVALFQKIAGMTVTRNIDELTEGGFNEYTWEFPREFAYNHITFEAGLSSSDFFYKWMMYGKEKGISLGKGFVLEQKFADQAATQPKSWTFDGAYPVRWTISDLSITNTNAIVIETLELSFNFFQLD